MSSFPGWVLGRGKVLSALGHSWCPRVPPRLSHPPIVNSLWNRAPAPSCPLQGNADLGCPVHLHALTEGCPRPPAGPHSPLHSLLLSLVALCGQVGPGKEGGPFCGLGAAPSCGGRGAPGAAPELRLPPPPKGHLCCLHIPVCPGSSAPQPLGSISPRSEFIYI